MKKRTWKVLEWDDEPADKGEDVVFQCRCGRYACCPAGKWSDGMIIAITGMSIITDPPSRMPPPGFTPTTIECRRCGRVYSGKEWKLNDGSTRK